MRAMNAPPFQGGDAAQQALQSGNAAAEPDVRTGSPAAEPDARDGTQGAHSPHDSVRLESASSRAAATLMRMSHDSPSSRRVFYDQVCGCMHAQLWLCWICSSANSRRSLLRSFNMSQL